MVLFGRQSLTMWPRLVYKLVILLPQPPSSEIIDVCHHNRLGGDVVLKHQLVTWHCEFYLVGYMVFSHYNIYIFLDYYWTQSSWKLFVLWGLGVSDLLD